jgi:hypothetical protein
VETTTLSFKLKYKEERIIRKKNRKRKKNAEIEATEYKRC